MAAGTGDEVTVLGGGIAGLATAAALAARGRAVTVLERAAEIAEVGAGLQISPNGVAVLDALGIGAAAREAAPHSQAVVLCDGPSGRRVLRMPLGGRPFLLMHRADLIALLARAARSAGARIVTGCAVTQTTATSGGWRLDLADGRTREAGLLIGADGVGSRLRPALNGTEAAHFTGQVAWRAIVPVDGPAAAEATVEMGPGRHLVHYPLRDRRAVNLVGVEERDAWTAEGWHHRDDPAAFRTAFAGFAAPVRALLDRVEEVHLWGLHRHPVAAAWHGPRAALVGDAAHPTLPFLAQGANLALEDAWVLADALARWPEAHALPRYQAIRRARAVRAIEAANANARNYHHANSLKRWVGHTGLRAMGAVAPEAMLRRFEWLYGLDVTAAPPGRAQG
ncbi:FAD-dependent oxidoreductase [Rhodobacteraceae bacterium CCMM004]|nr:FAD-dependent oxidoreductase [Rhodobacteraceae bacterium CCMM004]